MTNEHQRRQAIRAMRGKLRSPGRPSTARREDRVRFWEAIGRGLSSEEAAVEAGVASAVGTRWFRDAGGMPPLTLAPVLFEAGKAAGGDVLHEPRVWPEYHPDYYGAFVRDPDGNNVEAVCHIPE
jgi:hypothetical protein